MSRVPRIVRFTNTDRALQLINIMAISRRFHLLWKYLHLRVFISFPCEKRNFTVLVSWLHIIQCTSKDYGYPLHNKTDHISKPTSCTNFSLSFSEEAFNPNKILSSYYLIQIQYLSQSSLVQVSSSTTEIKYSPKVFVSEIKPKHKVMLSAKLSTGSHLYNHVVHNKEEINYFCCNHKDMETVGVRVKPDTLQLCACKEGPWKTMFTSVL